VSEEGSRLQKKFSELFAWERTRRREKILLAAASYALLVSLVLLPVRGALPAQVNPAYFPPVFFFVFAALQFFFRRWREIDSLRALSAVDRTLGLEERTITAAEILRQDAPGAPERYVLGEAGDKLKDVDVRALFKRQWSWQALSALPLLLLWLTVVWLGVGADFGARQSGPASLAGKLKDFSRELKQKAEAEKLAESLKIAEALRELAEERLAGKTGERALGEKLAAIEKRLGEKIPAGGEDDFDLGSRVSEDLAALKAELEAAKGPLRPGPRASEKDLLERLQALPRLSEAMEQGGWPMGNKGAQELQGLQGFLDKLERDLTGELDRRSLADARDFLSLLLRGGDRGESASEKIPGTGEAAQNRSEERAGGQGQFAGDQPGTQARVSQPPPGRARGATELPGILGEGKSSGFDWRGEAKAGASKIPEQEVTAAYRRQVEEDLAVEKIPPALKETVKKYFLSLGMTGEKSKQ
jgi:hypothetical protein